MHKAIEKLPEIKLVGITVRTNNTLERDPATGKIGPTFQRFFAEGIQNTILNRKNSGTLFSVYTNYESDEHGEYTYFLGEEVSVFENIAVGLETLSIPVQSYVKLTSDPGKMPFVVIDMWHRIWKMTPADLGGKRAYIADFEVYDERSQDKDNAIIDIYIGITP